ncbi:MAG: M20 family peptidase [Candidatus Neomarinimicrobiota bacterium]
MKKVLAVLGAALGIIVVIVLVRTFTFTSRQVAVEPVGGVTVDTLTAAAHLSKALTFRTISYQDPARFDPKPFRAFNRFLEETYPVVHQTLKREVVNNYSLLYTWAGDNPDLKPIILLAHSDVVPVDPETVTDWTQPPFSGAITDGYIWGRGAMDDKASLLGLLEAVGQLISHGFRPQRTVILAFGHDEEIGGQDGALQIVRLLQSRDVQAEYVLDEGLVITHGIAPGLEAPVAMIGIAEKGYLTVELSVESEGGHSSMPPSSTGVGILSRAVTRLEVNQRPATLRGPVKQMFDVIGPEMPFFMRMAFANLWLFAPLVKAQLAAAPTTNAMIRTTTAATMASGSLKENILPSRANMVVNFRLLPGETSEMILEHVRRTIDDRRVMIKQLGFHDEPSAVAGIEAPGYQALEHTIRELFPEVIVAPSLVVGATDSRHYRGLSPNTYRFIPTRVSLEDMQRIHGTDEHMGVENFADIIRFYVRLIENTASFIESN